MAWVRVKKGDAIPAHAILAGETSTDGQIFIGRADTGEIGKYNTSSGTRDGKVHNLWVHNGGCKSSGEILCAQNHEVSWSSYNKGWAFPKNAFVAGHYHSDGTLWVGRLSAHGEVGKINSSSSTSSGKMHHLWCHHTGKSTSGQILVLTPKQAVPLKVTPKMVLLFGSQGGVKATFKKKFKLKSGYSTKKTVSSEMHYKVSEQIKMSGLAYAQKVEAATTKEIAATIAAQLTVNQERYKEEEIEMELDASAPIFVYQLAFTVHSNPPMEVFAGSFVMLQQPLPVVR